MSLRPPTEPSPPALFALPAAAPSSGDARARDAGSADPGAGGRQSAGRRREARRPEAGRTANWADVPPAESASRQLPLFGVASVEPSPDDLAGLLGGPGQIVRMGGTARVSVTVTEAWRVHVLIAELALRGLKPSWVNTVEDRVEVRTAYVTTLAPMARRWLFGTAKRLPVGFHLNGAGLRLWVAAAGSPEPHGYLLRLGPQDSACWEPVGGALVAVGLPADLLDPVGDTGPAYRIAGQRPVARLAELVGDRPAAAPVAMWPGGG